MFYRNLNPLVSPLFAIAERYRYRVLSWNTVRMYYTLT